MAGSPFATSPTAGVVAHRRRHSQLCPRLAEATLAKFDALTHAEGMGELIYGAETSYTMEDRTLSHVKVAAGAKLRRQESFYLSWVIPSSSGSGRVSLWLSPAIPLQFHFLGNTPPKLNPLWIRALEMTAVSDRGMVVIPEAEAEAYIREHPGMPA